MDLCKCLSKIFGTLKLPWTTFSLQISSFQMGSSIMTVLQVVNYLDRTELNKSKLKPPSRVRLRYSLASRLTLIPKMIINKFRIDTANTSH